MKCRAPAGLADGPRQFRLARNGRTWSRLTLHFAGESVVQYVFHDEWPLQVQVKCELNRVNRSVLYARLFRVPRLIGLMCPVTVEQLWQ